MPIVTVSDVTLDEPATGSSNATFSVSLANPSSRTVTVRYADPLRLLSDLKGMGERVPYSMQALHERLH